MINKTLIFLFILLAFVSCKKENSRDCFKSTGKEVREVRYPGDFKRIDVIDKIEVTVVKGNTAKVEITGGEHVLKNISTEIEDGVLKIKNNNKCNVVRGYKKHITIKITMPYCYSVINNSVEKLTIDEGFTQDSIFVRAESSGDVHLNGTFDYVKAHANGNGDLYLDGSTKSLDVYINGTNFLYADDFTVTDYAFVQTLTLGDCFFNAAHLNKFEYIIYNKGNIYYKGNPAIIIGTLDQNASGQLIKED